MKSVAIILARGGSKGIPNKNIIDFCGKPLISWSIEQCLKAVKINSVWVSSDSIEILDIANNYGVKTINRPSEYANDSASSESAWLHAYNHIRKIGKRNIDAIVTPQVTSPIRESSDFDNAIDIFQTKYFDSLFSCFIPEIKFFWEIKSGLIDSSNYDYKNRPRRQDIKLKQYFENGSFYIFKPKILTEYNNRLGGEIGYYSMPEWKSFEIDNNLDLHLCKVIMESFIIPRIRR